MTISTRAAAVGTGPAAAVPALTESTPAGEVTVVAVEGDDRPMHVSLLLAGRLRADSGVVELDGRDDPDALRRRVALVDTPMVAEPDAGLAVRLVVAEELQFAGRPARRADVDALLRRHGIADAAREPFRALPTAARIRLLAELALARPGVDALVVTSPERHGGDPAAWYPHLAALAAVGRTIVVITDAPTARQLASLVEPVETRLETPAPRPADPESRP